MAVFGSSMTEPGTSQWHEAEIVGRHLAGAGLAVITGGYGGTMEAVSKGASERGGHVVGVTASSLFPKRAGPNPHVKEVIDAPDLVTRIGTMMSRASGVIALPGSIGTAAELLMAWNINHIARNNGTKGIPTVAVGIGWQMLTRTLVDHAGAVGQDIELAANADEAVIWLLRRLDIH